ncbi:MAG: VanW family protein [Candidatus Levybacteria bacterium]|nr:VanW family protein [Candidatus Levybacteria bacterium]
MLKQKHLMIAGHRAKHIAKKAHYYSKGPFWFLVGFSITGLTIISLCIIVFQNMYKDTAIPGVYVDELLVSGMSKQQIENIYNDRNTQIENTTFTFSFGELIATASAKDLGIGYDSKLIAEQSLSLGKSSNLLTNIFIVVSSYISGTTLQASHTFNSDKFTVLIQPLKDKAFKTPVDAQFIVENNKVTTFKKSEDGIQLDVTRAQKFMEESLRKSLDKNTAQQFVYEIPAIVLKPEITTEEANSFGIVEEIGSGTSLFQHSIPNRIHNVKVASSKVNGILVKPGEEFSFVKYLGDVSKATGYASAYVIQDGRTVLGDGGGVCQVSTTLYRAILNSGLPVTERHPHSYRVSYYEEDSPPGLDATVFYPSVDLKFVNDTGNYILIQSVVDPIELRLTYTLYGKKDGRQVSITKPVVTGISSAPAPLYQDDPSIPKGTTKQVDWSAPGAISTFYRIVKDSNGKVMIDEKVVSRYSPWKAVFLVGTG